MAFERLKKAVRSWMQTTGADLGVAKEFKSIFELGGVPAFQQFYNFGIYPWKWLYRGYYEAWHLISAPTVADPRAKRKMYYLSLSKAVCSELAGMVWTDQTAVSISTPGFKPTEAKPTDPLEEFVGGILKQNNFGVKMLDRKSVV